jgi:hypothetical protein
MRCLNASQEASHSRVSRPSRTKNPVTRVASIPVLCHSDEGGDDGDVVEDRCPPPRRQVAQGDPQDDGEEDREDAQLDRRRQPLEEDLEGIPAGQDGRRGTEVSLHDALHEADVLHPDRLVEAERVLEAGPTLGGRALSEYG